MTGLEIGHGPQYRGLTKWRPEDRSWQNMLAEGLLDIIEIQVTRRLVTPDGVMEVTRTVFLVTGTPDVASLKHDFEAWFTGHYPCTGTAPTHLGRKFFGRDSIIGPFTESQIEKLPENAWWSLDDGVVITLDRAVAEQVRTLFGSYALPIAN